MFSVVMLSGEVVTGWYDGTATGFTTDRKRRVIYSNASRAMIETAQLFGRFPNVQLSVVKDPDEYSQFTKRGELFECNECGAFGLKRMCDRCHTSEIPWHTEQKESR